MNDTSIAKETAIRQFLDRVQESKKILKFENADLPAGMPMYFYCSGCGIPTEVLREDFIFRPFTKCSQCYGMEQQGWLDEAKERKVAFEQLPYTSNPQFEKSDSDRQMEALRDRTVKSTDYSLDDTDAGDGTNDGFNDEP